MAPLADFLVAAIPKSLHLPAWLSSYQRGQTPLSTDVVVYGTIVGYLSVVFGLREIMRTREALKLQFLFQLHNALLSLGSLVLLVLMLEEIVPIWWNNSLFHAICNPRAWTPRMEFYYIVNYYFKFWELIDTVFLALKKKPLAFLHVFHHAATALLCYSQLNGKTSVSWVVITLNLTVHVIMYYYYYATAGGRRFWWKKYLTSLQIIQFIIDLFVVYFASTSLLLARYTHASFTYLKGWPVVGDCAGSESAALFGCGLLTSYLGLFINFYIQTYRAGAGAKRSAKAASAKLANGSGPAPANGTSKHL
ncbi:GNS1/SUR4 membrane protein [Auriculariales sp. MPI-PUGE-AT-0066]|nr:GNS1/SUR4 membrane protein [Auriculariales sp. MPI-PUGE-AT-0066]